MEDSSYPSNEIDEVTSQSSEPIDNQEIFGNDLDSYPENHGKEDQHQDQDEDDFGEFVSTTEMTGSIKDDELPSTTFVDTSLPQFYDRRPSIASFTNSMSAFSRLDTTAPTTSSHYSDDEEYTVSTHVHSFEPLEIEGHNDSDVGESSPESGHDDELGNNDMNVNANADYRFPSDTPNLSPGPPHNDIINSPMLISSSSTTGSPLIHPSTPESSRSRQSISKNIHHSIDRRFHTRMSSNSSLHSGNLLNRHLESVSSLLFGRNSGNSSPNKNNTSASTSITTGNNNSSNEDLPLDLPYQNTPWEPIRWSKLRKISSQLYSETAFATYGHPTCVLPASFIAVGMSRGQVLVFDYQQTLKHVLGLKAKLPEWGEVTSLAISSDHTFVGVGYSQGHIVTWELSRPTTPNIHIYPLANDFDLKPKDNKEGHLIGSSVVHLSFVDKRHSALISADTRGMAFVHDTVRNIRRHVKTKRILGRYRPQPNTKNRPMTVFACAPRPLGHNIPADDLGIVALMTPYLLVVVSIHPQIRTQLKFGRSKDISSSMGLSACLAWLPALRSNHDEPASSKLAYCWSNVVHTLDLSLVRDPFTDEVSVTFSGTKKLICDESIVAVQWLNSQVSVFWSTAITSTH